MDTRKASRRARLTPLALLAILLVSCGPTAVPGGMDGSTPPDRPTRTLLVLGRSEPTSLAAKGGIALGSGGTNPGTSIRLFNAGLAMYREAGGPRAYLSESLPELGSDSWRLFPDGRMETVYRLRPNLTWHDGAPLSAEDFVFSFRVYSAPDLGLAGSTPQNLMEDVVAMDGRTLLIRWRAPYPEAGLLGYDDLPALPRHILESDFGSGRTQALGNHPYWTTEYVGSGPFRMERRELGALIETRAFDNHALGRPRIDRLVLRYLGDANVVLANLLAGEAHIAVDGALGFQQAAILKREWDPRGAGSVLLSPTGFRAAKIQLNPEYARPGVLADLRARRALAHAIDRKTIVEGLFEGYGRVADTPIAPQLAYFSAVDSTITKYAYDGRRAQQMLEEMGFARRPDGPYADPRGEALSIEWRVLAGAQNETEAEIATDGLRRLGIESRSQVIGTALVGDLRVNFPALFSLGGSEGALEPPLDHLLSTSIPKPENRYTGNNRGGWSNPSMDRLAEAYNTTLNTSDRTRAVAEMMKLVSDELPIIPIYYNFDIVAHMAALHGPKALAAANSKAWNVSEWELD